MISRTMGRLFSIILVVLFSVHQLNAGVIVLEGHYQGKNLYVQNPFAGSGVGFCTFEVTINGSVTTDEVNSSAFEIDFSNFKLNIGDPVIVKIKHKDDCKPKILNSEVLKPRSTFDIVDIKVEGKGKFTWSTKNETGKLNYIIEQYRWNKWIKVGEVNGLGAASHNNYKFNITPHSGENKFRVKQVDYSGTPRYSQSTRFLSNMGEITFSPKKANKEIIFTGETLFEIYDTYGGIVKKGFGKTINVTNLKQGMYYLSYDNKNESFIKK